jgi:hypothetical protein
MDGKAARDLLSKMTQKNPFSTTLHTVVFYPSKKSFDLALSTQKAHCADVEPIRFTLDELLPPPRALNARGADALTRLQSHPPESTAWCRCSSCRSTTGWPIVRCRPFRRQLLHSLRSRPVVIHHSNQ